MTNTIDSFLRNVVAYGTKSEGDASNIVMSTRIRLARNIAGINFPRAFTDDAALQVEQKITHAVQDSRAATHHFSYFTMADLAPLERQVLVEKHLISPQLANTENGAVMLAQDESLSLMINEEDHLRIQCLKAGLQLQQAYDVASFIDREIEKHIDYAFREDFGYLTTCPTNVGTGLRASVMLHLPALTLTSQMNAIIHAMSRLGMVVRGIYGEGSSNLGNIYQVSNQITLGKNEQEILTDLSHVVEKIIQKEEQARQTLMAQMQLALDDRVNRSLGTLRYAKIVTNEEASVCLSNIRLGVDLKLLPNISLTVLNDCMGYIQPGFLQYMNGEVMQAQERDVERANVLRRLLAVPNSAAQTEQREEH